jgi:hypothetical protein
MRKLKHKIFKVLWDHTASKGAGVRTKYLMKPRWSALKPRILLRPLAVSEALSVWCQISFRVSWERKEFFKNHSLFLPLPKTYPHSTAGKVHIKESSNPFFLEQEKSLMHSLSFQFTWEVHEGKREHFLLPEKVSESSYQCCKTDTVWPCQLPKAFSESPLTASRWRLLTFSDFLLSHKTTNEEPITRLGSC